MTTQSKRINRGALLVLGAGIVIGASIGAAPALRALQSEQCGAVASAQTRTTLYFGTNRPIGSVSELEWQVFLRDEVTTRFPEGLTVWDAQGQWRTPAGAVDQERSKVLLLVHPDTAEARASVQSVIALYRKTFDQQSVLWETSRVCVAS
jgi:hypothetical protein